MLTHTHELMWTYAGQRCFPCCGTLEPAMYQYTEGANLLYVFYSP